VKTIKEVDDDIYLINDILNQLEIKRKKLLQKEYDLNVKTEKAWDFFARNVLFPQLKWKRSEALPIDQSDLDDEEEEEEEANDGPKGVKEEDGIMASLLQVMKAGDEEVAKIHGVETQQEEALRIQEEEALKASEAEDDLLLDPRYYQRMKLDIPFHYKTKLEDSSGGEDSISKLLFKDTEPVIKAVNSNKMKKIDRNDANGIYTNEDDDEDDEEEEETAVMYDPTKNKRLTSKKYLRLHSESNSLVPTIYSKELLKTKESKKENALNASPTRMDQYNEHRFRLQQVYQSRLSNAARRESHQLPKQLISKFAFYTPTDEEENDMGSTIDGEGRIDSNASYDNNNNNNNNELLLPVEKGLKEEEKAAVMQASSTTTTSTLEEELQLTLNVTIYRRLVMAVVNTLRLGDDVETYPIYVTVMIKPHSGLEFTCYEPITCRYFETLFPLKAKYELLIAFRTMTIEQIHVQLEVVLAEMTIVDFDGRDGNDKYGVACSLGEADLSVENGTVVNQSVSS
jgi:hypothetical protein